MDNEGMKKLTREEQIQIMEECTADAEQMDHHDLPPMRIAIWASAFFAYRTTEPPMYVINNITNPVGLDEDNLKDLSSKLAPFSEKP